jgi:hypothetical protein
MPEALLPATDENRVVAGAGAKSAMFATHQALKAATASAGQISRPAVDLNRQHHATPANQGRSTIAIGYPSEFSLVSID